MAGVHGICQGTVGVMVGVLVGAMLGAMVRAWERAILGALEKLMAGGVIGVMLIHLEFTPCLRSRYEFPSIGVEGLIA